MNTSFIKNTEILMYNGEIKQIQDINIGDYVMGADFSPLKVNNINNNVNKLYKITHNIHNDYYIIDNNSHITLKYIFSKSINKKNNTYVIRWFDKKTLKEISINFKFNENNFDSISKKAYAYYDNISDNNEITMHISKFLKLPISLKSKLQGVKTNIIFSKKNCIFDPYQTGFSESMNIFGLDPDFKIDSLYKYNSLSVRQAYIAGMIDSIAYIYNDDKYNIDIIDGNENNYYIKDLIFMIKSIGLNCIYKNNVLKIYGKEVFNLPLKKNKMKNKLDKYNNMLIIEEYGNDISYNLQFEEQKKFILGNCIIVNGSN